MKNDLPARCTSEGAPLGVSRSAIREAIRLLRSAAANRDRLSSLSGAGVIESFETRFAEQLGARHAVAVSSGGMALVASLLACDIGPGDEVIVSPYGWGQTVAAVLAVGATPVFADVEAESGNLDPEAAAAQITPRTRAVLVTHLFGCPARMDALEALCSRHSLALVSDAAQALGATLDGRPIGAWGDLICFSFGRGKAIATGEGGMVCANDAALYERLVLVSQHPLRALRDIEDAPLRAAVGECSLSARLSPLAAALGSAQLEGLSELIARREASAGRLARRLEAIGGFRPQMVRGIASTRAWYQLVLRVDYNRVLAASRGELIAALREAGVPAAEAALRGPLHLRPPFYGDTPWLARAFRPGSAHPSWRPGACPRAENRCNHEDIILESESRWEAVSAARLDHTIGALERLVR